MPEQLLGLKSINSIGESSSATITLPENVHERLGGVGTDVAIVADEGKVYLVPATEVSLL